MQAIKVLAKLIVEVFIGGGGGGGASSGQSSGGNGGSGIVILKVPTASYSGTVGSSPTVITEGSNTLIIFKASGTYTS